MFAVFGGRGCGVGRGRGCRGFTFFLGVLGVWCWVFGVDTFLVGFLCVGYDDNEYFGFSSVVMGDSIVYALC